MKPEEQSSKESKAPERSSPLKNMDQEQRKFAVLVALAFLIIFLGWLATWQWQSSAERNKTVPTQSFFQNTTEYTKPGIDSLKKITHSIFQKNNSQDQ